MIQIKPHIAYEKCCPHCGGNLCARRILWQGIHVCAESSCTACGSEITGDLEVGQALFTPYQIDLEKEMLFGDEGQRHWFGAPLLDSLRKPDQDQGISLEVETVSRHARVVILNCIDFLYGHALLKLLNAETHLKLQPELGLVVIVPRYLRWMVPQGVAEIWTVNIPLGQAKKFFPRLDQLVHAECERFDEIYLSPAHSHPRDFDIVRFTGVARHDFGSVPYRITFIWREDRPWIERRLWVRIGRRVGLVKEGMLSRQNAKVVRLFSELRRALPQARLTVAGLGTATAFPDWVDDQRAARFDDETERRMCRVYGESRLVIGVHGSNMLLPSAHAGMTIDLMPDDRWPNMAQDLLYQEADSRLAAYRYRYLPLGVTLRTLAAIAGKQIQHYETFNTQMNTPLVRNSPDR